MPERELEEVMKGFYQQRYNVLLCTTIIETGIDVPTANTIVIHRADRLGLAQLHQLRGRVGRYQIGRASCRARVGMYEEISGGAVSLKIKKYNIITKQETYQD